MSLEKIIKKNVEESFNEIFDGNESALKVKDQIIEKWVYKIMSFYEEGASICYCALDENKDYDFSKEDIDEVKYVVDNMFDEEMDLRG